jgi:hypothetical protein
MGCNSCGRNKKNITGSRLPRTVFIPKDSFSMIVIEERTLKCKDCPYSSKTSVGNRCKKSNRLISKIVSDPGFKCPIGRF